MQEQWLSTVNDLLERKTFHRLVREESELELKLIELGLTEYQREQVLELMYDYNDEPNPKVGRKY